MANVSKKDAIRALWKMGNLDYKRHATQIDMKKYIKESGKDILKEIEKVVGFK